VKGEDRPHLAGPHLLALSPTDICIALQYTFCLQFVRIGIGKLRRGQSLPWSLSTHYWDFCFSCSSWPSPSLAMTRRHAPDERRSPAEYGLDFAEVTFRRRRPDPARLVDPVPARSGGHHAARAWRQHGPDVQYVPALQEAGFSVLMFDFRAHGRSDGRLSTSGYLEQRDVLGAVAFLRAKGLIRLGLFGFSMGARVASSPPVLPRGAGRSRRRRAAAYAAGHRPAHPGARAARRAGRRIGLADPRRRFAARAGQPVSLRAALLGRPGRPASHLFHSRRPRPLHPAAEFEALVAAAGPPKEVWRLSEAGTVPPTRSIPSNTADGWWTFFNAICDCARFESLRCSSVPTGRQGEPYAH